MLTKEENGLVVYSASSIGRCPVALYYDRMGVTGEPTPDWLQAKYDEGVTNENLILRILHDQKIWVLQDKDTLEGLGYRFGEWDEDRQVDYREQVRVEAPVLPGIVVRAHLDGIAALPEIPEGFVLEGVVAGQYRVVEVKAFGEDLWDKFKRHGLAGFPLYQWQLASQMKGAGLNTALFVVGHKGTDGRVFEIGIEYVNSLPIKWLDVIQKINGIEQMVGGGDELACPKPLDYPCPYYKLHTEDEIPVVEDETERKLVISLAEEYERHRIAEKHHKDLKGIAGKAIAKFFDDRGEKGGKVKVGGYQVNDTVFEKEGNLSAEKLTAAMPGIDLSKYRNADYEVRYPTITRPGDKDGNAKETTKETTEETTD